MTTVRARKFRWHEKKEEVILLKPLQKKGTPPHYGKKTDGVKHRPPALSSYLFSAFFSDQLINGLQPVLLSAEITGSPPAEKGRTNRERSRTIPVEVKPE
jgi:hypothetical protein